MSGVQKSTLHIDTNLDGRTNFADEDERLEYSWQSFCGLHPDNWPQETEAQDHDCVLLANLQEYIIDVQGADDQQLCKTCLDHPMVALKLLDTLDQ